MANQKAQKYKVTKGSNAKQNAKAKANKNEKLNNKNINENGNYPKHNIWYQIMPYLVIIIAALIALFVFFPEYSGTIGGALHNFFFGVFSGAAYIIPFFLIIHAIIWITKHDTKTSLLKVLYSFITTLMVSSVLHLFLNGSTSFEIATHYVNGKTIIGGGVVGGLFGELLRRGFGVVGGAIICFSALIVFTLMIFDITPRSIFIAIVRKANDSNEERKQRALDRDEYRAQENLEGKDTQFTSKVYTSSTRPVQLTVDDEPKHDSIWANDEVPKMNTKFNPDIALDDDDSEVLTKKPKKEKKKLFKSKFNPDVALDDDYPKASPKDDAPLKENRSNRSFGVSYGGSSSDNTSYDFDGIPIIGEDPMENSFSNSKVKSSTVFAKSSDAEKLAKIADGFLDDEIDDDTEDPTKSDEEIAKQAAIDAARKKAISPRRSTRYKFPPIDLLERDAMDFSNNDDEETNDTARKLVETLANFKVNTKVSGICHGPTVTRYELIPETGVKVKQIVNLTEDITLYLATDGIRIATIPGKPAIGVEVPNKSRSIVQLRNLIENKGFDSSKSKLWVALGRDVAGDPIYCDIAKTPHLLIAGATGMGKSVCINCILISLLYKATPEEVKLILIDPKKVEFTMYKGLPHLLTPVVSDPKKAAGSLSWAVNEMERRYDLIEGVGARNISSYNEAVKDDSERPQLPQIVIVIDELADLMATAPDDVENSIMRLAAKARAAGIHLIIGTQRPSVDVITGTIKNNIPSRIAFTVTSQVDSRTIIDSAGAEKLIGKGDMLFAPIGDLKPKRVQGAYVDEKNVEQVVEFIKNNYGSPSYSDEVLKEIENEAAKCGLTKKQASALESAGEEGETDEDPKFNEAVKICIANDRASTSLLQRRLSIGYGRAAKIIDRMCELGYVSESDGASKPRKILITMDQFDEMTMNESSN